jgi:hypothetical protein
MILAFKTTEKYWSDLLKRQLYLDLTAAIRFSYERVRLYIDALWTSLSLMFSDLCALLRNGRHLENRALARSGARNMQRGMHDSYF